MTTQLLSRSQQLDFPLITVQVLNKFSNEVKKKFWKNDAKRDPVQSILVTN